MRDRSVRSWLTIMGIVISIAVILILLTMSTGLSNAIVDLFEEFGANNLYIVANLEDPTALGAASLLTKDVDTLESMPYFKVIIPILMKSAQKVSYKGIDNYLLVAGIPNENTKEINDAYKFEKNLIAGRYFQEGERFVAILGYDLASGNEDYFQREIGLKNSIYVNGTKFKVVGIYKEMGTSDDQQVMIPLEDAREIWNEPEVVNAINAVVKDGLDINMVEEKVIKEFERKKGEDEVIVMSPESILKQFNNIMFIVTGILMAIALISLIVGAVGIANNMFTAVLEREKEIGIMKSIGAQNKDILTLFMIESGLIGLLGGIVGIILGILGSYLIGFITKQAGFLLLNITISPFHVIFCIVFSFAVGIGSGFLPSYRASKKIIVETLREN